MHLCYLDVDFVACLIFSRYAYCDGPAYVCIYFFIHFIYFLASTSSMNPWIMEYIQSAQLA